MHWNSIGDRHLAKGHGSNTRLTSRHNSLMLKIWQTLIDNDMTDISFFSTPQPWKWGPGKKVCQFPMTRFFDLLVEANLCIQNICTDWAKQRHWLPQLESLLPHSVGIGLLILHCCQWHGNKGKPASSHTWPWMMLRHTPALHGHRKTGIKWNVSIYRMKHDASAWPMKVRCQMFVTFKHYSRMTVKCPSCQMCFYITIDICCNFASAWPWLTVSNNAIF